MKEVNHRDHFSELPEPLSQPKKQPVPYEDSYLKGIELYIETLSKHIHKIQDEEVSLTEHFTAKLNALKGKTEDRILKQEEKARTEYQKDLHAIRQKRKQYREMLFDAMQERKKLLESMQIQKDEDEVLKKKLSKLGLLTEMDSALDSLKSAKFDKFGAIFIVLQICLIILYGTAVTYADPVADGAIIGSPPQANDVNYYYHYYTDVAFMVFIGLGFLMTFLRKYGYSALGFTFFTACFVFQWSLLVVAFFDVAASHQWSLITMNMEYLVHGMYGAFTCLVSFGALIGNVTPTQLLLLVLWEVPFYGVNRYICLHLVGGVDFGGSMLIHQFGAYFGLAASWVLSSQGHSRNGKSKNLDSSYNSDMFAMIGTLFLWVLFPSFNAAVADDSTRYRIIGNTVLALCSSCILGFITSRVLRGGKFDMADVQNATIAGGVALGTSAFMITPGGALITGAVVGLVAVITSVFVVPWYGSYLGISDTRGVLSVHGIPGVIGGIASIVAAAISVSSGSVYGVDVGNAFPSGSSQASHQLAILFITFALSLAPGLVGGLLIKYVGRYTTFLTDELEWKVPKDFEVTSSQITEQAPVTIKAVN